YLDVTIFGADPTGKEDSTEEIQAAIDAAYANEMVVLFPSGTYLVSDSLKMMRAHDHEAAWRKRTGPALVGSTKGPRPVIKLADQAEGFDNPSVESTGFTAPTTTKAVVHF